MAILCGRAGRAVVLFHRFPARAEHGFAVAAGVLDEVGVATALAKLWDHVEARLGFGGIVAYCTTVSSTSFQIF